MKIRNFCSVTDPVKRMKGQIIDGDKYLQIILSDKRFVTRVHKDLSKLNNKKTNNPIRKWAKHTEQTLH